MLLWELGPAVLVLTLDHLVTLGEHPEDPYEGLVFFEYLKYQPSQEQIEKISQVRYGAATREGQSCPGLHFVALLLELRSLGRHTPLRHRGFAQVLAGLKPGQSTLAIRSMQLQAARGDEDATRAMVRAAIESRDEQTFASLCEALQEAKPVLHTIEDFLLLYADDPEFALKLTEFRQIFFPPLVEFPPPAEIHPQQVQPTPPKQLPNKPRWSVSSLAGPGSLAVASSSGRLELLKVADDSVLQLPAGYRYSTYISPKGSYKGGGVSRRITSSRLSDDLSLVALYYHDGTMELLGRVGGKPVAQLPRADYTCFAQRGSRILVGGPQGLFSLDSKGSSKTLTDQPIRALGPGPLLVHWDGVVTVKGKERFQVDPTYQIRVAPDGSSMAIWDHHGEVEIFDPAGEPVGRFYAGENEPDLSYSLESDSLVMAQKNSLKRWNLDGSRLADLYPQPGKSQLRRSGRQPDEEYSMDLEDLARHDGFFDRLVH